VAHLVHDVRHVLALRDEPRRERPAQRVRRQAYGQRLAAVVLDDTLVRAPHGAYEPRRRTLFRLSARPVEVGNTKSPGSPCRVVAFHVSNSSRSSGCTSTVRTPAEVFDWRTRILPLPKGDAVDLMLKLRGVERKSRFKRESTPDVSDRLTGAWASRIETASKGPRQRGGDRR
jgi:hypothetical protein